uniref:Galectin domain-containing protein n=1 Tax=Plectus sambesii TaxID=2011161 RepID=A0A914XJX8_9BILA
MPHPRAYIEASKAPSVNKDVQSETVPGFVETTGGSRPCKKWFIGWVFRAIFCFLFGALGAWIFHVAFLPSNECILVQKEDGIEQIKPSFTSQIEFTQQEQAQAMQNEVAVMPLHCKISKADGLGNGTTIVMSGMAQKEATKIDIFFKNPAGIYTFYMELRWLPFENSVFFTTQSSRQFWKTFNDDYRSPNPLENERGGLFRVVLESRLTDMQITIVNSFGEAKVYSYKHKEGFDQAASTEAILSGNVQSVSDCRIL